MSPEIQVVKLSEVYDGEGNQMEDELQRTTVNTQRKRTLSDEDYNKKETRKQVRYNSMSSFSVMPRTYENSNINRERGQTNVREQREVITIELLGEEKTKKALLNNDFKLSRLLESTEFANAGIIQIRKNWTNFKILITIK